VLLNPGSGIAFVQQRRPPQAVSVEIDSEDLAMTEYQKIAIGLLGLSHPEIYLLAHRAAQERSEEPTDAPAPETPTQRSGDHLGRAGRPGGRTKGADVLVRGIKFAFASLLTGSRVIPLGDNSRLTKELGAYGARLHHCD
jgi:hypothetical protein